MPPIRLPIRFTAPSRRPTTQAYRAVSTLEQPMRPRYLSMPRVLQPSFWGSMVPRPLRRDGASTAATATQSQRGWNNPATPFMILGMLVGSQAIQMIWLKQERAHALRRAEAKIGILREVIGRVQRGEEVDVEGVLGGEAEWAEVIKEVREEEALFQDRKTRRALRQEAGREEQGQQSEPQTTTGDKSAVKVEEIGNVRFY